jgi:putative SOS response-associated peptidase YedK
LPRWGGESAPFLAAAWARAEARDGVPFELCEANREPLRARFNLAPSQEVLTLVPTASEFAENAAFAWKRWGLVPSWAKDPSIGSRMFNARSETVETKPSFRAAFKRRRCLVVADGFYEWTPKNRDHRPFYFQPTRQALLGFAGLYEEWRGEGGEVIESCTVLTTGANADLEGVHHRMPVILDPAHYSTWLDAGAAPEVLKAIAVKAPNGTLERRAVTRYVNDPRRDDERCLSPEPKAVQVDLFSLDGADDSVSLEEEF